MLYWTAIFFVVAVISGMLGFTGIAAASAGIAKAIFYVFIALFLASLVLGIASRADKTLNTKL